MKKAFSAFLFLILLICIDPVKAYANLNFSTDFKAEYTVSDNATTHVKYDISLKNLTKNFFVSKYNLELGFTDITNLEVTDSKGKIVPSVTKSDRNSLLSINFNERVVGVDKTLPFEISFDTNQIAQNQLNVWDINIPGISDSKDFNNFDVTLNYPKNLEFPTYIKPDISSQSSVSGTLVFTKKDVDGSGISISFGRYQIYDLDLKYHLKNTNLFTVTKEIALPPDTNYQTVQINSISPKPINVVKDQDGNWMASYKLSPQQEINIVVNAKAKVNISPSKENINDNLKQKYLLPQKYWESDNTKIINLAKSLKTPQNIYDYVVKTLSYDYSKIGTNSRRLGALGVLSKPDSALCLEFTDLFIALSRAAGIPAREVDGYAYTKSSSNRPISNIEDILHAWPEYYDFNKQMWIMIDPTWGNTTGGVNYFDTMDFDHITFVIRGNSSTYPIPAGGYKLSSNSNTKDINVSISTNFDKKIKQGIATTTTNNLISGISQSFQLIIYNNGNEPINNQTINLTTNGVLTPQNQTVISNTILPFGNQIIPVTYITNNFLTNSSDTIKITLNNRNFYKKIYIEPFYKNKFIFWGGIIIVSISIFLPLVAFGIRRISVSRRK